MVAKKDYWRIRKVETASLSFKKTIPIPIEEELRHFRSLLRIGGTTETFKQFLVEESELTEKEYEEKMIEYALSLAKIKRRENPQRYRKWLANKILEKAKTKEQKERFKEYVEHKEFI